MKSEKAVRKVAGRDNMTVVPMRVDRDLWDDVGRIVQANPFFAKVDIARIAMRIGIKQLKEGASIALSPIKGISESTSTAEQVVNDALKEKHNQPRRPGSGD